LINIFEEAAEEAKEETREGGNEEAADAVYI